MRRPHVPHVLTLVGLTAQLAGADAALAARTQERDEALARREATAAELDAARVSMAALQEELARAQETADRLGITLTRVPTVGVDPAWVSGLADLLLERAEEARGGAVPTGEWVRPSVCAPGCCPNLRQARPALCGSD